MILENFKEYLKQIYPNGVTYQQYNELKMSYYGGAIYMASLNAGKEQLTAVKEAISFWDKKIQDEAK